MTKVPNETEDQFIPCSVPKFLPYDYCHIIPIFYDPNIYEEEKVHGLRGFLEREYKAPIPCAADSIIKDFLKDSIQSVSDSWFPKIPVILKRECPVIEYSETDDWIAQRIASFAQKNQGNCSKEEICKILKYRNYTDRVLGCYYHSGCPQYALENFDTVFRFEDGSIPYIEIFYRNVECTNTEDYEALMGNCLAHEYFHFLHDILAGKQFKTNTNEQKSVVEGLADFFSVYYTLKYGNHDKTARIELAQKKYARWQEMYGSSWPYAYALDMFKIDSVLRGVDHIVDSEIKDKFNRVLSTSRTDMRNAFALLTRG